MNQSLDHIPRSLLSVQNLAKESLITGLAKQLLCHVNRGGTTFLLSLKGKINESEVLKIASVLLQCLERQITFQWLT